MRTQILAELKQVANNKKIRLKDIMEWSIGEVIADEIVVQKDETLYFLPDLKVWCAMQYTKQLKLYIQNCSNHSWAQEQSIVKALNLYAGIGGNRRLWSDVEVTAVEYNPEIAEVYSDLYPQDTVIIGDAHQYLLDHYQEFDFIWTSPPCQSHSSMRQNLAVRFRGTPAKYPDMSLYQEIIFLQYNFGGLWVVENVRPYYEPLIRPTIDLSARRNL